MTARIMQDTVMLGADNYETDAEVASLLAEGRVPIGIGENTKIKYKINCFGFLHFILCFSFASFFLFRLDFSCLFETHTIFILFHSCL